MQQLKLESVTFWTKLTLSRLPNFGKPNEGHVSAAACYRKISDQSCEIGEFVEFCKERGTGERSTRTCSKI